MESKQASSETPTISVSPVYTANQSVLLAQGLPYLFFFLLAAPKVRLQHEREKRLGAQTAASSRQFMSVGLALACLQRDRSIPKLRGADIVKNEL